MISRPVGRSVRRVALGLISLCLAVTACSDASGRAGSATPTAPIEATTTERQSTAPAPSSTTVVSEQPAQERATDTLEWRACGQLECATVAVPLSYSEPEGATIDIAIARRRALTSDRRGAIFVNPGGPGASGVDFVQSFVFAPEIMAAYDVIGFDPRGVGASTNIGCELDRAVGPLPDHSPDTTEELATLDAAAADFADECGQGGGELLANLDTETVARDLDRLRIAVGDDRLNYYGFSFGTLIGQLYADLFPNQIDHLVLDGVVDPTKSLEDLLRQQAAAFEESFDRLDQACGTTLSCPDGGAADAFVRILDRLETDGAVGEVGPTELEASALVALYNEDSWPFFVSALSAADDGDYTQVEVLSDLFSGGISFAAYAAVECSDSPHPIGTAGWDAFADELRVQAPRFGAWIANELRTCAHWPVPPGPARTLVSAPGAPPILVVGTTNDPATPFANAQIVADGLESGVLVSIEADQHTGFGINGCIDAIIADYFVNNVVPDGGASC